MAEHVIIQVRDDIISRIKAAATAASTRVYAPYEVPVEEVSTTSPFVIVEVGDDQDTRQAIGSGAAVNGPQILEDIVVSMFVHCIAKLDGDAEKTAYALRGQIETALLGSNAGLTLGGLVLMLTRVAGFNNRDQAIEQEAYSAGMQLAVQIRHLEGSPTSFTY